MAHLSAAPAAIDTPGHNLRFLNEEWNDSISNGLSFTLRWNQSLERDKTELGLFRIRYPQEGVVVYDLVTNLTGRFSTVTKGLFSLFAAADRRNRFN